MPTDYPNDYEPQDSEMTLDGQSVSPKPADDPSMSLAEGDMNVADNVDVYYDKTDTGEDYATHSVETITPEDLAEDDLEFDTQQILPEQTAEPEFAAIDISILNKEYTINCPVGEEQELFDASQFINTFIKDLQQQAPQLPHENLLVLCCLNLYEKLQQSKNAANDNEQSIAQANQLVDQMIKDMQLASSPNN